MNRRAIWAIAHKDMNAIRANLQVWLPMVIVPVVLGVVIPGIAVIVAAHVDLDGGHNLEQIMKWLDRLPPSVLKRSLAALPSLNHQLVYLLANYLFAPFFLLIPLMTSSVISADSFAGEKERGTLENLLFAPLDLLSLFAGKVIASFLPAVVLSLATFLLCGLVVNIAGWPLFHAVFFPHLNWLPLMLLLVPMLSLTAILLNVFISARVASFQAAYQMGGLVVLPIVALLIGQLAGVLLLDATLVLGIGVGLALVNLLLLRLLLRRLDRNSLFESQIR